MALPGVITSGGTATGLTRLYLYNNNATTINSIVANNAAVVGASTRLVVTALGGTITFNGVNTYTVEPW